MYNIFVYYVHIVCVCMCIYMELLLYGIIYVVFRYFVYGVCIYIFIYQNINYKKLKRGRSYKSILSLLLFQTRHIDIYFVAFVVFIHVPLFDSKIIWLRSCFLQRGRFFCKSVSCCNVTSVERPQYVTYELHS